MLCWAQPLPSWASLGQKDPEGGWSARKQGDLGDKPPWEIILLLNPAFYQAYFDPHPKLSLFKPLCSM